MIWFQNRGWHPPDSSASSSHPWAASASQLSFVFRTFQNSHFSLFPLFFGFVSCHFGQFSQHCGHWDRSAPKITDGSDLAHEPLPWMLLWLSRRWGSCDSHLLLQGMSFPHSPRHSLFIFLYISFFWWLSEWLSSWMGLAHNRGKGMWCWEQRGNGSSFYC